MSGISDIRSFNPHNPTTFKVSCLSQVSQTTQKLANTTLLIGYDSENRCIHVNLLENAKDGDWSLVSIRNQKYRKMGVRKLIVLMFGPDGRIINQFYDDTSRPVKRKTSLL
jgi:hypothetical protein